MRNKKQALFFTFIFAFLLLSYKVFIAPNRTRLVETHLRGFPKQEFKKKLREEKPLWMQRQIEEDLKEFAKKDITEEAIEKTYKKIVTTIPNMQKSFMRYRIIDNKLYRYYPKGSDLSKREPSIEKALKTLTKLVKLPDMDFIVSDKDGTPEYYTPKDFYLLDNKDLQAPILSRAKILGVPYVILIPDYYSVSVSWERDCVNLLSKIKNFPWEQKKPLAFWRGGAHDKGFSIDEFKKMPRMSIAFLSKKHPDFIEAGINKTTYMRFPEMIEEEGLIKPHASVEDHLEYKYLPVIDGYMCTYPGYQWRLLSNSVCFKQESKEVQWFYSALKPYEHYIPIKSDMSDLVEKVKWALANDEKCLQISKNATDFVLNNLMIEDVYIYLYNVLKTYSSKLNINKHCMLQETLKNKDWVCVQQRSKANKVILKRLKSES